ncbi:MAG: hypothetical protein U0936_18455 [Planctomycetaceae bacterium]
MATSWGGELYPFAGDSMAEVVARQQSLLSKAAPAEPELPGVEFSIGTPSFLPLRR